MRPRGVARGGGGGPTIVIRTALLASGISGQAPPLRSMALAAGEVPVDLAGDVALEARMISGLLRPSIVRRST